VIYSFWNVKFSNKNNLFSTRAPYVMKITVFQFFFSLRFLTFEH